MLGKTITVQGIILGAAFIWFTRVKIATAINCYVCNASDSSDPFQCGEWFDRFDVPDLKPQNCSGVYGAKYCVKHIGRYEVTGIKCYQCSSARTIDCSDVMVNLDDSRLQPEECDSIHGAAYCIKSTALDGGIGAKRFCSSKDLGNYCNYVKNRGDTMEYRSCIFTCNTDGCNHSTTMQLNKIAAIICATLTFGVFLKKLF